MGRYSKSYSTYILRKKHQNVTGGEIFERDWLSIGNVHRLEPGKKPYYSDGNFVFTDNSLPFFKKKYDYGKWVAHFVYDDVKDSTTDVNEVKVNRDSNDLRSYVYYGSAEDLIRGSFENIIRFFPGRLTPSISTLSVQDIDGSWIDTHKTILDNPFNLDMHTQTVSITDFENELRYLTSSWNRYNIVRLDSEGKRVNTAPIVEYVVTNTEGEVLESKKYHDLGFDFICYKDILFKWNDSTQKFEKIEYSTNCNNYFVMCDEYIRQNDEYYEWSYEDGQYIPINVLEICNDNYRRIFSIKIKAADIDAYLSVDMYKVNGSIVYCSLDNNFIIEPNKEAIDSYFNSLEGFERKLLTRDTKPYYRNVFKVPYQLSNGAYALVDRVFVWPSTDYCIDIESIQYTTFLNSLMDAGALYDEVYSDCIWRCMTHESIKNFDWTYRREYSENDAQDNIEGGERMMEVLRYHGRIYDEAKRYVDGIRMTNNVTYNGYDNMPDAEISDKNDIKGWDIVSTIWEPYYYTMVDSVPEGVTVVPYPVIPTDVNTESPEWISIGCEDGAVYYHKEYNDPAIQYLTEEYLDNDEYIIENCNPWIRYNHNAIYVEACIPSGVDYTVMDYLPECAAPEDPEWIKVGDTYYKKTSVCYVEVSTDPMANFANYWTDRNTLDVLPGTITSTSPRYLRIIATYGYRYYVLTEHGFDSTQYIHNRWYASRNCESVTPSTCDINFNRILHLSTNRIFKTKGTRNSIDMVMAMFGLGSDGNVPDYSITEYYDYTSPIKSDSIFYFYNELMEEPQGVTWETTGPNKNVFDTLEEAIINIGSDSQPYIMVNPSGVPYYYELNGDYSYEQMIMELYRHREPERLYDDVYTGTPINSILIGNDKYIIPYYAQKRVYDGYLYFQQKGGWGKKTNTDFQYDYSETVPYLHLVPNVESLLSILSNELSEDDVYYVFDTSDYVNFDEDVPFNLSHFFKAYDKYNPQRFSSWKNIPMTGEIVYDVNYNDGYVTHLDYLHAKYLNDIIPSIYFNNPHTGIGKYDLGKEYFEYMKNPYKYLVENYGYDDSRYVDIAKQFVFSLNEIVTQEPNGKFAKWLNTVLYDYNNGILEQTVINYDSSKYFLNNKLIILKNNINNPLHKKFLKDVVLKYVLQVIPSTSILVLENFEVTNIDEMTRYNVVANPNDVNYGETEGSGNYIVTTMAVLKAIEKDGFHFVRWERVLPSGNVEISTEPITQVMVCDDAEYLAIFEEDCVMDAACDVTCGITLGCENAEICSTTLLCDTEDQCDIEIVCSDETPGQTAIVEYNMTYYGVRTIDDVKYGLSDRAVVFDNTCDFYNTIINRPQYVFYNASEINNSCKVTAYPTTLDVIDPSTLKTIPFARSFNTGYTLGVCAAKDESNVIKFRNWIVKKPDNTTTTYTTNPLTLILDAGTTKITAVYEQV